MSKTLLILHALRVRQWTKNTLVFAAPAAAGVLLEAGTWWRAVLAFLSFSLVASMLYVANDLVDREADRRHPRKAERPFASGALDTRAGIALMAISGGSGFALALRLPTEFAIVLLVYVLNTLIYSIWGKRIPTLDMMHVALGFVLRAVGGAVATEVVLSQWFLAAAMFGSLLMVAGKRSAEVDHVDDHGATRPVLLSYSPEYLHQVTVVSATGLLMTYALWALSEQGVIRSPWALISFGPFLYAVLRYVQLSDAGATEEPETLVLRDPGLIAAGTIWAIVAGLGIYA